MLNTSKVTGRVKSAPGPALRIIEKLFELSSGIGSIWFFALVAIIITEVVAREVFSAPIRGITEVTAYSLVGATFLQLPNIIQTERMIRVDFLLDFLRSRVKSLHTTVDILASSAGALVMYLLMRATWPKLTRSYAENELVGIPGEFSFEVWPLRVLVLLGSAMALVAFAARIISTISTIPSDQKRSELSLVACVFGALLLFWHFGFPFLMSIGISNFSIGAVALVGLTLLLFLGVHVGVAMILAGFVGLWLVKGRIALPFVMLGISGNEFLANYYFSAVPLFVLMGLIIAASDIGHETFIVARWATRRISGGLGIAIVGANTIFAAITGSSIASASVFARIATPELIRHGYLKQFSVGVVAGSSVLGMLIPPSLLLIVYGFLAEQSVGKLFIAAIVPGLILAGAMCLMIWLRSHFMPNTMFGADWDPSGASQHGEDMHVGRAAILLAPILGLVFLVLGGIYGGFYTPTEGGAVGAAGALIYALVRRRLDRKSLWGVMVETGQIATTVLFLILAANIFTVMLASSGFVQAIGTLISNLDLALWQFAILYALVLIALGMFLESISIMLIMVPIALPAALILGGDPIWFGILTVISVEIGLLTPPFGLCCYVVNSTLRGSGISLTDIFAGAMPFIAVMAIVVLILIGFPNLGSFVSFS